MLQFSDVTIVEVGADRRRLGGFHVDHIDLDHALNHCLHHAFGDEGLANESVNDVKITLA